MQEISWSAEDKDKGSPLPFETSSLLLLPPPVLWWGVQSVVCIAVLYWQNLHWSMKPSSSCNCYIIIITRHNVAVCSTRHAAPEQRLHPPDNVNRHRPLWRQHRLDLWWGNHCEKNQNISYPILTRRREAAIIMQCWCKLVRGSRITLVCHISLVLSFNIRYLFFVGAHSHQSYTLDVSRLARPPQCCQHILVKEINFNKDFNGFYIIGGNTAYWHSSVRLYLQNTRTAQHLDSIMSFVNANNIYAHIWWKYELEEDWRWQVSVIK